LEELTSALGALEPQDVCPKTQHSGRISGAASNPSLASLLQESIRILLRRVLELAGRRVNELACVSVSNLDEL
jgi:hypothetical protein